ncbi:MAG: hypothetical protein ACJA0C_000364 [Candidatus Endobugula sp.]|jgi:hypothetical protein
MNEVIDKTVDKKVDEKELPAKRQVSKEGVRKYVFL